MDNTSIANAIIDIQRTSTCTTTQSNMSQKNNCDLTQKKHQDLVQILNQINSEVGAPAQIEVGPISMKAKASINAYLNHQSKYDDTSLVNASLNHLNPLHLKRGSSRSLGDMSPERNPGNNQLFRADMQDDDEHDEDVNVFAFHGYGDAEGDLENVTEVHQHQNHDEPDMLKSISIISQVPKNHSDMPLPQIDAIASSATFGIRGDVGSSEDRLSHGCKQKR